MSSLLRSSSLRLLLRTAPFRLTPPMLFLQHTNPHPTLTSPHLFTHAQPSTSLLYAVPTAHNQYSSWSPILQLITAICTNLNFYFYRYHHQHLTSPYLLRFLSFVRGLVWASFTACWPTHLTSQLPVPDVISLSSLNLYDHYHSQTLNDIKAEKQEAINNFKQI